jgi:ribosomal protein S18 acetylase RimI-like enzyme
MDALPPHNFRSRPYGGEDDLSRMLAVCSAAHRDLTHGEYYHIGDVIWQLFRADVGATATVRLWEDENGTLLGFALPDDGQIVLQIHPAMRGDDRLEDAMLAWAEEACRSSATGEAAPTLDTDAFDDDAQRLAVLARRGYHRADDGYGFVRFHQPLDGSIPAPELPPGFTVRHVVEADFPERVALHREVWAGSRVTVDSYRGMRAVTGYLPDLDIVAVAPDGTLASYCICWYDPESRTGLYEPVGTRPAYRGQGIGTAVIREGLRRLQAHGARLAIVHTNSTNTAAIRLYESAGFRIVSRDHPYRKMCTLPGGSGLSSATD